MVNIEQVFGSEYFNEEMHKNSLNPYTYYLNARAKVEAIRNANVTVSNVEQMQTNFENIKSDTKNCIEHLGESKDYFHGLNFVDKLFSSDEFCDMEFLAMKLELVISETKPGVSTPSLRVIERGLNKAIMTYGKDAIAVSCEFKLVTRELITTLNKHANKIKIAIAEIDALIEINKLANRNNTEGSEEIMKRRIAKEKAFWADVGRRIKK